MFNTFLRNLMFRFFIILLFLASCDAKTSNILNEKSTTSSMEISFPEKFINAEKRTSIIPEVKGDVSKYSWKVKLAPTNGAIKYYSTMESLDYSIESDKKDIFIEASIKGQYILTLTVSDSNEENFISSDIVFNWMGTESFNANIRYVTLNSEEQIYKDNYSSFNVSGECTSGVPLKIEIRNDAGKETIIESNCQDFKYSTNIDFSNFQDGSIVLKASQNTIYGSNYIDKRMYKDTDPPKKVSDIKFPIGVTEALIFEMSWNRSADEVTGQLAKLCESNDCNNGCIDEKSLNNSSFKSNMVGISGKSFFGCVKVFDKFKNSSDWAVSTAKIEVKRISSRVAAVSSPSGPKTYKTGDKIVLDVKFSSDTYYVNNQNSSLKIKINIPGSAPKYANYVSGSGTSSFKFEYVVEAGDDAGAFNYSGSDSLVISDATLKNVNGDVIDIKMPEDGDAGSLKSTLNGGNITIDTSAPIIKPFNDVLAKEPVNVIPEITGEHSRYLWVKESGPGSIYFYSDTALSPKIGSTADGSYVINFTAFDSVGNSSSAKFNFKWDTTPPVITGLPTAVYETNKKENFTANVNADGTSFKWSMASSSTGGNINFGSDAAKSTSIVADKDGMYTIRFSATDKAGNTAQKEFTYKWDRTAPVLDPIADILTNIPVTVSTKYQDGNNFNWLQESGPLDGSLSFEQTANLNGNLSSKISSNKDGEYIVKLIALDGLLNSTVIRFKFVWDTTPPVATVNGLSFKNTNKDFNVAQISGEGVVKYKYAFVKNKDCSDSDYSNIILISEKIDLRTQEEARYTLCVKGIDEVGNIQVNPTLFAWNYDITPPKNSSISINNGEVYTNLEQVELSIDSIDAVDMYVTNDGSCENGGVYETFSKNRTWTLAERNKKAYVFAKFRDEAGNETNCVSASVIHDNIDPSAQINNTPKEITNNDSYSIQISGEDVFKYKYSLVRSPAICNEESYSQEVDVSSKIEGTLPSEGIYTLCVKGVDLAKNTQKESTKFTWNLDKKAPKDFSLSINENDTVTNDSIVTLNIKATDLHEMQMYITNMSDCSSGGSYEAFSNSKSWTLNQLNSISTVYVKLKDAADNETSCFSDFILHDNIPPVAIIENIPKQYDKRSSYQIDVKGSDIDKFEYSLIGPTDSCSGAGFENNFNYKDTQRIVFDLPTNEEKEYKICVRAIDLAGNIQPNPTEHSWTHDDIVPQVILTGVPDEFTTNPDYKITVVNEGLKSYKYSIIEIPNTCSSAVYTDKNISDNISGKVNANQERTYIICVKGLDLADNEQIIPTEKSWSFVIPPSDLRYINNPVVYTKNEIISNNIPTNSGGFVKSYTIDKALPDGLFLNENSGIISGTPKILMPLNVYKITATNKGGSTSVELNLTVNDVPPSNLKYEFVTAVYTKGTTVSDNIPSNDGGKVVSYSVSPALPAGLSIDLSTGVISGRPSVLLESSEFTITANNSGGSTSTIIYITVNDVPPSNLNYTNKDTSYIRGVVVNDNKPSNDGGKIVSYVIEPAPPSGISFDNNTGIISGTPSILSDKKAYKISAFNTGGSTEVYVSFDIKDISVSLNRVKPSNDLSNVATYEISVSGVGVTSYKFTQPLLYSASCDESDIFNLFKPYGESINGSVPVSTENTYKICVKGVTENGTVQFGYSEVSWEYDGVAPLISTVDTIYANKEFTIRPFISGRPVEYFWEFKNGPGSISISNSRKSNLVVSGIEAYTDINASLEGEYFIKLTATDKAGNSSFRDFKFIYDKTAPVIQTRGIVYTNTTYDFKSLITGYPIEYLLEQVSGPSNSLIASPSIEGLNVSQYEVNSMISASTDGEYTYRVSTKDLAGNENSELFKIVWDTVNPKVNLISKNTVNDGFYNIATIEDISLIISEKPARDLSASDITVENGTVDSLDKIDDLSYNLSITKVGEGEIKVSVKKDIFKDLAGNNNDESNVINWIYDVSRPTVAISHGKIIGDSVNLKEQNLTDIEIKISELPINSLGLINLTLVNAEITSFTGDKDTYKFSLKAKQEGVVSVSVEENSFLDRANNYNIKSNTMTWLYDATPPTAILTGSPSNNSITNVKDYEYFVSGDGIVSYKYKVINAPSVCNDGIFDDTTNLFSVPVKGSVDSDNIYILCVKAIDLAGNIQETTSEISWTYDNTAPSIQITTTEVDNDGFNNKKVINNFLVSLSENPKEDLTEASFTVENGSVLNFSKIDIRNYKFSVESTNEGITSVYAAQGAFKDIAGNNNIKSNTYSWEYDFTRPTAVIFTNSVSIGDFVKNSNINNINLELSELPKSSLTPANLTVLNGSITNFTGNGKNYKFTVVAINEGKVAVSLADSSFTDRAGNSNYGSDEFSWNYDITPPKVLFTTAQVAKNGFINIDKIEFTADFSEDIKYSLKVSDFDLKNISIINLVEVSKKKYTFTAVTSSEAYSEVSLDSNSFMDNAGNYTSVKESYNWNYDITKPTASISSINIKNNEYTNKQSIHNIFINLSEIPFSDLTSSNFTTHNANISDFSGNGNNYTFTLSAIQEGQISVSVDANSFKDRAGNFNNQSNILSWNFDNTPPKVTILGISEIPTNLNTYQITIKSDDGDAFNYKYTVVPDGTVCSQASYSQFINFNPSIDNIVTGSNIKNIVNKLCLIVYDRADNETKLEETWIHDSIPPSGGFKINNSDLYTSETNVTIDNSSVIGADFMSLSINSACSDTNYETFNSSKDIQLNALNSLNTVYIKYKDLAGNESGCISESITHDNTPPVFISLNTINDAEDYFINLSEKDSNAVMYQLKALDYKEDLTAFSDPISIVNNCDGSKSYNRNSIARPSDLSYDGSYLICVRIKDEAGNITYGKSEVVTKDTLVPALTSFDPINEAAPLTGEILGYINKDEQSSGLKAWELVGNNYDSVKYSDLITDETVDCNSGDIFNKTSIPNISDLTAEGKYFICSELKRQSGNIKRVKSKHVIKDVTAPIIPSIVDIKTNSTVVIEPEISLYPVEYTYAKKSGAGDITFGSKEAYGNTLPTLVAKTTIFTASQGDYLIELKSKDKAGNVALFDFNYKYDNSSPFIESITSLEVSNGGRINKNISVIFELSEETETLLNASNFSLVNASILSIDKEAASNKYTISLATKTEGVASSIFIEANSFRDLSGNFNLKSSEFKWTYDTTRPSVNISNIDALSGGYINKDLALNITVSETPSREIKSSDISVYNGNIKEFSGSNGVYIAKVSAVSEGAVSIEIKEGVFKDIAGNDNAISNLFSWNFDSIRPSVTITRLDSGNNFVNQNISFKAVVSESPKVVLTASNFSLVNGTIVNFTRNNLEYNFEVKSKEGNSDIYIAEGSFQDIAGNENIPSNKISWSYDTTKPTVTISSVDVQNNGYINKDIYVDVILSETPLQALKNSDFALSNCDITEFSTSNGGKIYKLKISSTGEGISSINMVEGAFTDLAGNNNTKPDEFLWTYDVTKPSVLSFISTDVDNNGRTNKSDVNLSIELSESPSVALTSNSFNLQNITIKSVSPVLNSSNKKYNMVISAVTEGTLSSININQNTFKDKAGNDNNPSEFFSYTFDTSSTEVTLLNTDTFTNGFANADRSFKLTLSETPKTDLTADKLTVVNGTINNFSGSGTSYTFNVAGVHGLTSDLYVKQGEFTDIAGNLNKKSNSVSWIFDNIEPTATIDSNDMVNRGYVNYDRTFSILLSESPINNLTASKFLVTNGSIYNFTGSDKNYTFKVQSSQNQSASVLLPEGAFLDKAGNENIAVVTSSWIFDTTGPTAVISSSDVSNNGHVNRDIYFEVTLNEEPSSILTSDLFTVSNGTIYSFNVVQGTSNRTYGGTLRATSNGFVSIQLLRDKYKDIAGNNNFDSNLFKYTFDTVKPRISSVSSNDLLNNGTINRSIIVSFTLSETPKEALVISDFSIENATVSSIYSNGLVYSLTLAGINGLTSSVAINSDSFTDLAGNGNEESASFTWIYDAQPPTAVFINIMVDDGKYTNVSSIPFTLDLSKSPASALTESSLLVTNGIVSNFVNVNGFNNKRYTFNVSSVMDGLPIEIRLPSAVFKDLAGNNNTEAKYSYIYDITPPTMTMSSVNVTEGGAVNFNKISVSVSLSEQPKNALTPSLFDVKNGVISNFKSLNVSNTNYSFDFTSTTEGALTSVSTKAGLFYDLAGNANINDSTFAFTYDGLPPLVSFQSIDVSNNGFTNKEKINVKMTISEQPLSQLNASILYSSNITISDFVVVEGSNNKEYTFSASSNIEAVTNSISLLSNKFTDLSGNNNLPSPSFNWIFDKTPPSINQFFIINSATNVTDLFSDVPLLINVTDAAKMFISTNPGCTVGIEEIYSENRNINLDKNKLNTIYAKFSDSVGNWTACVSDDITQYMVPNIPTQTAKENLLFTLDLKTLSGEDANTNFVYSCNGGSCPVGNITAVGVFSWTPPYTFSTRTLNNSQVINVSVNDTNGKIISNYSFTINVLNVDQIPSISISCPTRMMETNLLECSYTVIDPDSEDIPNLTISSTSVMGNILAASVNSATSKISFYINSGYTLFDIVEHSWAANIPSTLNSSDYNLSYATERSVSNVGCYTNSSEVSSKYCFHKKFRVDIDITSGLFTKKEIRDIIVDDVDRKTDVLSVNCTYNANGASFNTINYNTDTAVRAALSGCFVDRDNDPVTYTVTNSNICSSDDFSYFPGRDTSYVLNITATSNNLITSGVSLDRKNASCRRECYLNTERSSETGGVKDIILRDGSSLNINLTNCTAGGQTCKTSQCKVYDYGFCIEYECLEYSYTPAKCEKYLVAAETSTNVLMAAGFKEDKSYNTTAGIYQSNVIFPDMNVSCSDATLNSTNYTSYAGWLTNRGDVVDLTKSRNFPLSVQPYGNMPGSSGKFIK